MRIFKVQNPEGLQCLNSWGASKYKSMSAFNFQTLEDLQSLNLWRPSKFNHPAAPIVSPYLEGYYHLCVFFNDDFHFFLYILINYQTETIMYIFFCCTIYCWFFSSLWVPWSANKIHVLYFHYTIPLKGSASLVSACDFSDFCGSSADFERPEISEINCLTWSILSTLKLILSV